MDETVIIPNEIPLKMTQHLRQTMVKFAKFHSLRMSAKNVQIFGPSSHELPIRVCENTGGSSVVT